MKVKVIFDLYFYQVLYVLCLYKAQISGERLQDHWSSGLIFVGIGVTFACDDFIVYVILKKDASHLENKQIAIELHAGFA